MRYFIGIIVLCSSLLLISCTKDVKIKAPNTTASDMVTAAPKEDIAVYYPIRDNTIYYYEGIGNEYTKPLLFQISIRSKASH